MAASKKAAKGGVIDELSALIDTFGATIDRFNELHVEHIPSEGPKSACYARLLIEKKHLANIRQIIIDTEQNDRPGPTE